MGMDVGSKGGVRSDINITPLVDVVLVLLIIFMVITPMLQRGKAVELPKAKHIAVGGHDNDPDPLFISVTKDGNVFIEQDKQPADKEAVMAAFKETASTPGKRVMLKGDIDTEYGKVRPVLDWASKSKLKGVSLAAEELKGAK
jgi:biopolymer transport protein TolR